MKDKGAILIFLLLIVASCSVALVMITSWVSNSTDWADRLYVQNRAYVFMYTAFKISKNLLEKDSNDYDSKLDIWANLPPVAVHGGEVIVNIIPANSKIDLNLLFSNDMKKRQRTKEAIISIIAKNSEEDGESIIENIKGWVEKNVEIDEYFYSSRLPPIYPRKKVFYSLKEVDFVKGMWGFSGKFHKFFTVNGSSKININFASKEVIESYIPEIAPSVDELISYRQSHPFKNITQIRKCVDISNEIYLKIQPFITTKSNVFITKVTVSIDNYTFVATGIIKRNRKKAKMIKYFEGKGFYE